MSVENRLADLLGDVFADFDRLDVEFKKDPEALLRREGYHELRQINGEWYGLVQMLFTVGIACKLSSIGPDGGRICFDSYTNASRFLASWDGTAPPTSDDGMKADKRI